MSAPVYRFKPRDLAMTRTGRIVKIVELLPGGERLVRFMDTKEEANFRICHLTLIHEAGVRPWKEHTLR